MKKTQNNLILLNCIFVAGLIISNITAAKIVTFWGLIAPAAVVVYPLTFLMTDIIGEIWGKKEANRTVRNGLICQLISLALIGAAIILPVAPFADNQAAFTAILGNTFRMVFASLIAYMAAQSWDVFMFHFLKNKTEGKHKWLRNNASTMSSQAIDTLIFITIGFYGVVPNIWAMVASQYIIKFVLALLDTPFFYLLTRGKEKQERDIKGGNIYKGGN